MSWVRNPLAAPNSLTELDCGKPVPRTPQSPLPSSAVQHRPHPRASSPELRAGLIRPGSRISIPQACRRSGSSSSTRRSSPRSRSTTPSARCPPRRCSKAGLHATPEFFRFSFKAPQRITHFKRLTTATMTSPTSSPRLSPSARLASLACCSSSSRPTSRPTLSALATSSPLLRSAAAGAPPIAFEFRHESWFTEEIYAILRAHNAALCIAESDDLATPEVHTASTHTSFRLRRTGAYSPPEIDAFAQRFTALAQRARRLHLLQARGRAHRRAQRVCVSRWRRSQGRSALMGTALETIVDARRRVSSRGAFSRTVICRPSLGNFLPRVTICPPPRRVLVEVSPATENQIASQVRLRLPLAAGRGARQPAHCHHRAWAGRLVQLAVRRRQLQQALASGCNIVRMNMRNCGGTEALTPTLYHSGLSGDVLAVMRLLHRAVWPPIDVAARLLDGRKPRPEAGGRTRHACARRASLRHRRFSGG